MVRRKIISAPHKSRRYVASPSSLLCLAWLEDTYPVIADRARAEGAEIHWGDEKAPVTTDVLGCRFAPKGKTPVEAATPPAIT